MSKPRSLSLAAYRVLSWGVPNVSGKPTIPRPEGELIWVHVNEQHRQNAVVDFCRRLQQARPTLNVMLTVPPGADLTRWENVDYPLMNLPQEQTGAARAFLDHWQPDIGLWVGGGLMPNVITRAEEHGIPLILIEAQIDINVARGAKWLPDITRFTLDCFKSILTTKPDTARTIRRLGIASGKVFESPPLQVGATQDPGPRMS